MNTREPTDESLMASYVTAKDRSAFEALYRRHAPKLYAFFRRTVRSDHVAQDLTQQTFLHLHRARRDYRQGRPLRPWLYTIAVNVRRQHVRTRMRRPEAPIEAAAEPSTGPGVSTATDRLVRRALEELPEGQREVVVLHWYQGLSFAEIAEAVGASRSAVKVRAHRAYNRLRELLKEDT